MTDRFHGAKIKKKKLFVLFVYYSCLDYCYYFLQVQGRFAFAFFCLAGLILYRLSLISVPCSFLPSALVLFVIFLTHYMNKMWKPFYENDDLPLYLQVDGYRVLVTNHVKLWKKEFTQVTFQEMMVFCNQDVETNDMQKFANTGLSMLLVPNLDDLKTFTETANGNTHLELLRLGPIVWKASFELTLCDAEDFFYFVTRPLLMVIKDQVQSETSLRSQLIKKDLEIQGFMEMLPENSPLMRCLRTKKYNDQEHRLHHSAVVELFGVDPEDVICPKQIMQYKRTLPVLKCDDDGRNMDEPNSREIRRGPATTIKKESCNGGSSQANTEVKHKANCSIGKPNNVKTERKDGATELNHVKIEPYNSTSALNPVKNEPRDDESESNDTCKPNHAKTELKQCTSEQNNTGSNYIQSQSKVARTSTPSPIQTSVQPNPDLLQTGDEDMSLSIADHTLNTRQPNETLPPISPDIKPSQLTIRTPKKRRKNLNY